MRCRNCDRRISEGSESHYCPSCGTRIRGADGSFLTSAIIGAVTDSALLGGLLGGSLLGGLLGDSMFGDD